MLTRTLSFLTGPVGWIITGVWTAIDIAGPAYRVTIPACIVVATLRLKTQQASEDKKSLQIESV
nr:ubiquinol-cytochrome C chaperone family protein [Helicobacter pylori]